MKCFIVQHGHAVSKEENPQRPLSEQGINDIRHLARSLKQQRADPAHILHSGKARAAQTAAIIAETLDRAECVQQLDGIGPMSDAEVFAHNVKQYAGDVLIASHMPFVQNLCDALLGDVHKQQFEFKPGKLVCLELDANRAAVVWQSQA